MQAEQKPKLVDISGKSLTNIPANLRALADRIEAGEHGDVISVATILNTPESMPVLAFGDVRCYYDLIGMLQVAVVQLSGNIFT